MKRFSLALTLAALLAPTTAVVFFMIAGTAQSATADGDALMQIERDLAKAIVSADVKMIEAYEANELIITNPDGSVSNKAEDLAAYKSGKTKVTSAAVSDMKAVVIGDTGVTVGLMSFKGVYQGVPYEGMYRFTDTYVRRDGRWQEIATHASEIPKK